MCLAWGSRLCATLFPATAGPDLPCARYHPDKQADEGKEAKDRAERHFQRLTDAHNTLSDPARREEYDKQRMLASIMQRKFGAGWTGR